MPAFVLPARCDGCGACVQICPSGILHIDSKSRKAYNLEPEMCWECYPCVKACPQQAIDIRGYSDFVPLGARLVPKRDMRSNTITWTVYFRNGRILRFTFPIRSTPWGSIRPPQDLPAPARDDLKSAFLSLEPAYLGVAQLPVPRRE